MTTNEQIADLLLKQTYAERMEMARDLADVLSDAKADMSAEVGFCADDVASFIQGWADRVLEEESDA
jgi:hypothetical protein